MDREIKFRGKSVKNGEWFYGYLQKYQETHASRLCVCAASVRTWSDALLYEVIPETIGQYTGLKDKDGKEIYEGDILRSDQYPFSDTKDGVYDNYLVEVCWDKESCCFFGYAFKHPDSKVWGLSEGDTVECETFLDRGLYVIGNIHDNPELIKKEEQL